MNELLVVKLKKGMGLVSRLSDLFVSKAFYVAGPSQMLVEYPFTIELVLAKCICFTFILPGQSHHGRTSFRKES